MIKAANLSKHFRIHVHHRGPLGAIRNLFDFEHTLVKAVDEVGFEIRAGELVGYIGPNGAGKSTTIKMLTGLLVPTGGGLLVNGFTPWKDRKKYVSEIGAVFGQRTTLWWDLPLIESLELLQHIYQVPQNCFRLRFAEFRELLDLDPFLDTPVRALSLGQRMRSDICAALLHSPKLLFLDEPTIGLDVVAKERIRRFIRHINREHNTTVLLTTHDISDVEKLCKRVMIIDHGKLLYDGDLSTLKERFGGKRTLVVDFADDYPATPLEGAEIAHRSGRRVVYHFQRGEITASALIGQLSAKFRIHDIEVRQPEIEATIRRIYEERLLEE